MASSMSFLQTASAQLTASVTAASGTGVPSGNVVFSTGGKSLGSAAVGSNGKAILVVAGSALATGNNTIAVAYTPSGNFGASSGTLAVTVLAARVGPGSH